jgi:FolB domain-containing protein
MTPDRLTITDLELWTRIGVPEKEREAEQRLLVTVEMHLDVSAAAQQDDVTKSVNYADVSNEIRALAKTERKTVERLAEGIAQMILKKWELKSIVVTVKKFAIPGSRFVEISITR